MTRKNISSGSPFEKKIGFCRAVRVGNIISVAGTAPIGADGETVAPGDAYTQACRCLQIIKEAIEEAGGTLGDVVRTRMMLTDIGQWEDVGRAHREFFEDIRPASTLVEVSALAREDWLVEIEADAVIAPH